MHARHENVLVVAAVHHADFPARRNGADDTPEIIMAEFFLTGRFECRAFQRRRVQLPKHLFDEAVLARRVTRLNGNQNALASLRIEFILQCRRFRKVLHRLRLERLFIHELRCARLRVLQFELLAAIPAVVFQRHNAHDAFSLQGRFSLDLFARLSW